MATVHNSKSPAVKRLMREAMELSEATSYYYAQPLEDNIFEWHFTVRGPSETDYEGGIYHGRIILPSEYPMKPPNIIFLTPNGRFQTNRKVCLSISGHHPEKWQPAWSIRTALLAIIAFLPQSGAQTLESIEVSPEERRSLAKKSVHFKCQECGLVKSFLKEEGEDELGRKDDDKNEMKEIVKNMTIKGEEEKTEKEIIKEASKKTLQKFKERLESRLGGLSTNSSVSSAPSTFSGRSSASDNFPPRGSNRQSDDRDSTSGFFALMCDGLLVVLVVAIAYIVYRRLNLVNDGSPMAS